MRFPQNPILRRYLTRGNFRAQRYFGRVFGLTIVVFGIWWVLMSSINLTGDRVDFFYSMSLIIIFLTASVIAVSTVLFTQREARSQANEILRMTPISRRQVVRGYVGANLFIQRWTAVILVWATGIGTLLISVTARRVYDNNRFGFFPPFLPPELPRLTIGVLILLFGSFLGMGIVLMVVGGAVSAAIINRYPVRPAVSTIGGLFVAGIIPLVCLSWTRYPDTATPIILATVLMGLPLVIGWGLIWWWGTDWSPLGTAVNYVFTIILGLISFGFLFAVVIALINEFVFDISAEPAVLGITCSTTIIGLAILLACVSRWKRPSGIAPIIAFGWHTVILLATIYWVGYQSGGMTLWWMALYVMVILFYGFGFGNIEAAAGRLWADQK
jgi:hypothetical protein